MPASPSAPELADCASEWSTVLPSQGVPGSEPRWLCWQDGTLYFDQGLPTEDHMIVAGEPRIVSVPDSGGTPTTIANDAAFGLWVEGDRVLWALGDQLLSAPVSGGAISPVADGQMFGLDARLERNLFITAYALDASYLYFELSEFLDGPTQEWSVWRTPRAGGASERLATLPASVHILAAIVPLSDQLLLAGLGGKAFTLPSDGGDVRSLPAVAGNFVGADQSGVLWNFAHADQHGGMIVDDVLLSKPSGQKPAIFWRNKPAELAASKAWSDDAGWIISGLETFSDGLPHSSVWAVDRKGHGRRLACDRAAGFASGYATTAALSPDAAYVVVEQLEAAGSVSDAGDEQTGWRLMKVPR